MMGEKIEAPPLTLNHLLRLSDIDESKVLVLRHRPYEPKLNRIFEWIVAERPDLFECYQSTHAPRTEASLGKARYAAAFIRHGPDTALFVGMYRLVGQRCISIDECNSRPAHQELMSLGMSGFKATEGRTNLLEFNMSLTGWLADWHGRLVVKWPGGVRSWVRWANRNQFVVEAIAQENLFTPPMPLWDELTLGWQELGLVPSAWRAALSQWRGIYLIIDQSDGKQYVGSAYGAENILQRWKNYALSGHGGNKLLRHRDPRNFRFSILQRLSPDLPDSDVIRIERSWKERLRSIVPDGLNEN